MSCYPHHADYTGVVVFCIRMERSLSVCSVTILSPESANGRNVIALGVTSAFSQAKSTAVFRPAVCHDDSFTSALIGQSSVKTPQAASIGVCPKQVRENRDEARADIVAGFHDLIDDYEPEAVVIVGTDKSPIADPQEFAFNAQLAADLQSPVFLAVCTLERNPAQLLATVRACQASVRKAGSTVVGVFVTGCAAEKSAETLHELKVLNLPTWTVPPQGVDAHDPASIDAALKLFDRNVPSSELLEAAATDFEKPVTAVHFQNSLLHKAKAAGKTIVLPEGEEDRIIRAADFLLARDIVKLIIVGERDGILERAESLGLKNLDKAEFQSIHDEALLQSMTDRLCELRRSKGLTEEQARLTLEDPSYFGTMLVVLGRADGLVSGSVNSTANTVRPALQTIKTKPGASLVSGSFLMCFDTHVAIFADCAINLNPDAQALADIAIQSASTAQAFDMEPRVGMLSYSTLGSGKGPDAQLVEEATRLVHEKAPELSVVGPIQFDAAWSPDVASTKAPGNEVAGHVNVFVFPDLSAGNIAYKAVQRSSGALAVGPVLQGLNKPVNDLSRGATVQDIINTVALTAAQVQ